MKSIIKNLISGAIGAGIGTAGTYLFIKKIVFKKWFFSSDAWKESIKQMINEKSEDETDDEEPEEIEVSETNEEPEDETDISETNEELVRTAANALWKANKDEDIIILKKVVEDHFGDYNHREVLWWPGASEGSIEKQKRHITPFYFDLLFEKLNAATAEDNMDYLDEGDVIYAVDIPDETIFEIVITFEDYV